jgi:hypothetical protein
MTLIIASIVIFVGLIIHGIINYVSIISMQKDQNRNSRYIQLKQQQHEMEFAEMQAKMFREANRSKPV